MNIYEYAKLDAVNKQLLLNNALFIEQYTEDDKTIGVYFLNSFFVEAIARAGAKTEYIPYKRGYKIDQDNIQFLESMAYRIVV